MNTERPCIRLIPPSADCAVWRAKFKNADGIVYVAQGTTAAEAVFALFLAYGDALPIEIEIEDSTVS